MAAYVLRRLLWTPVLLLIVGFITFVLGYYGPGDPTEVLMKQYNDPNVVARIRDEVELGRQVYWVCPLIEESETLDLQNATATHQQLCEALPGQMMPLLQAFPRDTHPMPVFSAGVSLFGTHGDDLDIDDPKAVGTQAEIARAMQQYGPLLAPLLGSLMGGRAPAQEPAQYQVPAGYVLVPVQQSAPPPPAQLASADAPAQLLPQSEPTPEPVPVPAESMPVTATSKAIIAILEPMTPQQAAQWLIDQRAKFSEFFVDALVRVPDDHLSQLPDAIAAEVPDVAGVMAWLKSKPDWLRGMAVEVRRLKGKK